MEGEFSELRPASTLSAYVIGAVLKVLFWCSLAAEVAWLVLTSLARRTVLSSLGQDGVALAHLIALGALALSSGLLVFYERRINTFNEPDWQWTLAETLFAVMLFCSLFLGIYAFFSFYYAP